MRRYRNYLPTLGSNTWDIYGHLALASENSITPNSAPSFFRSFTVSGSVSKLLLIGMDAGELARWTRFAAKGGIGKCTATSDCIAESAEDLMFLKVSFERFGLILCSQMYIGRRNYSFNATW